MRGGRLPVRLLIALPAKENIQTMFNDSFCRQKNSSSSYAERSLNFCSFFEFQVSYSQNGFLHNRMWVIISIRHAGIVPMHCYMFNV